MNICCNEVSENSIVVQRGDAVRLQVEYKNEDGTAIDLTGRTLEVSHCSNPSLLTGLVVGEEITITAVDLENGLAEFYIPKGYTDLMRFGRATWFRISAPSVSDDVNLMSPKIWIELQ